MSSLTAKTALLRAHFRESRGGDAIAPSSYTAQHGRGGAPISCVREEYAIALIRGETLQEHADRFSQIKTTQIAKDTMYCFWYMLATAGDPTMGARTMEQSKEENPPLYTRVIAALARTIIGTASAADYKLCDRHTKYTHSFDVDEQREIKEAIEREEKRESDRRKEKNASADADGAGDDDADADFVAPDAPDAPAAIAFDEGIPQLSFHAVRCTLNAESPAFLPQHEDPDNQGMLYPYRATCIINALRMNGPRWAAAIRAGAAAAAAADATGDVVHASWITSNDVFDAADLNIARSGGGNIMPKMRMTMTAIRDSGDVHLGYLVRFLKLDPTLNPGKALANFQREAAARRKMQGARGYQDKYACHMEHAGTHYPVFNCSRPAYIGVAQRLDPDISTKDPDKIGELMTKGSVGSYDSPLHMRNMLTLEKALERFRAAGADPNIIGVCDDYYNRDTQTATFPEALADHTYSYLPHATFWVHPTFCGLSEKYFPDMTVQLHADTNDMDENMRRAHALYTKEIHDLELYCTDRALVDRTEIIRRMPRSSSYLSDDITINMQPKARQMAKHIASLRPTNAAETYASVQALIARHGALGWKRHAPRALARSIDAYDKYAATTLMVRDRAMSAFTSVFHSDGDLSQLPVSEPVRVIISYMRDLAARAKNITCETVLEDPHLSFLNNALIRDMAMLEKFAGIAQPAVSMHAIGLSSVYMERNNNLLFSIIIHGEAGGGKSYALVRAIELIMYMPGTWVNEDSTSGQADQTGQDITDLIRTYDDVESWMCNPAEEKGHAVQAGMKKTATTTGWTSVKCFVWEQGLDGKKIRSSEYTLTRQNYVEAGCTNHPVKVGAVADRYANITMKSSAISVAEYNHAVDAADTDAMRTRFYITQSIACYAQKAQAMGAMARFNTSTSSMWDYFSTAVTRSLGSWGVREKGKTVRGLTKMKRMLEQMMIRRAKILTWDVAGAPHYKKEFHPRQFREFERVLYATTDMCVFVLTQLSAEETGEDKYNVIRAAGALAGIKPEHRDHSNYQLYCDDTHGRLPWLRVLNTTATSGRHAVGGRGGGVTLVGRPRAHISNGGQPEPVERTDEEIREAKTRVQGSEYAVLIDPNYMQFEGNLQSLAVKLQAHTKPRMSTLDIEAVLNRLTDTMYTPHDGDRNGYGKCGEEWMQLHRTSTQKKVVLTSASFHHEGELHQKTVLFAKRFTRKLVARLVDLDPMRIDTRTKCEDVLLELFPRHHLREIDWEMVFLLSQHMDQMPANTTSAQVVDMARDLRARSDDMYKGISTDDIARIVRSCVKKDLSGYTDATFRDEFYRIQGNSYTRALCVLYGFDTQEFQEHGTGPRYATKTDHPNLARCVCTERPGRESDLPMLGNVDAPADGTGGTDTAAYQAIPAVLKYIGNQAGKKRMCAVAIQAMRMFDRNAIVLVIAEVLISAQTRPGKRLLGWVHDDDATKFQTLAWSKDFIKYISHMIDDNAPPGATSRVREGIGMINRGHIDTTDAALLYGADIAPTTAGPPDAPLGGRINTSIDRSSPLTVVKDLDQKSAEDQHFHCGGSLEEPVHTVAYLRKRYQDAGGKIGSLNYPEQQLDHRRKVDSQVYKAHTSTPKMRTMLADAYMRHPVLNKSINSNDGITYTSDSA